MIKKQRILNLCTALVLCTFIITQASAASPAQSVSTQTLGAYISKNIKPFRKPYNITLSRLSPSTWRAIRTDDGFDNIFEIVEPLAEMKDPVTTPNVSNRPVTWTVNLLHNGKPAGFYEYTNSDASNPLPSIKYIEVHPKWAGSGAVDILFEDFLERVLKGDRNARFKAHITRASEKVIKNNDPDENIYTISTNKIALGILSTVTYAPDQEHGVLDGRTILRFSHAYGTVGGVQTYLRDINKELLERNRMTIIQMYFSPTERTNSVIKIGKGELILVPIPRLKKNKTLQKKDDIVSRTLDLAHKTKLIGALKWFYMLASRLDLLRFMERFAWFEHIVEKKWGIQPDSVRQAMRTVLGSHAIDLVIIHSGGIYDAEGIIEEANSRKIPALSLFHGDNDLLQRYMMKRICRKTDFVGLVHGNHVPSYLRNKSAALFDGIDTTTVFHERAKTPLSINDPILGKNWILTEKDKVLTLPSRIETNKGHLDMLAALVHIRRTIPDMRLIIAGPADNITVKDKMVEYINEYNLRDNVIFTGSLTTQAIAAVYAISDVIALPSYSEGFPRVLLEAQAVGRPVVAYDVGGTSEAMIPSGEEQTGILIEKASISGLEDAITTLFTNDALYQRLQKNARSFVTKTFTFEKFAERHEEFYLKAIKDNDASLNAGVENIPKDRRSGDTRKMVRRDAGRKHVAAVVQHLKDMPLIDNEGNHYSLLVTDGEISLLAHPEIINRKGILYYIKSLLWKVISVRFRNNNGVLSDAFINMKIHRFKSSRIQITYANMGNLRGKGLYRHFLIQLLEGFPFLTINHHPLKYDMGIRLYRSAGFDENSATILGIKSGKFDLFGMNFAPATSRQNKQKAWEAYRKLHHKEQISSDNVPSEDTLNIISGNKQPETLSATHLEYMPAIASDQCATEASIYKAA